MFVSLLIVCPANFVVVTVLPSALAVQPYVLLIVLFAVNVNPAGKWSVIFVHCPSRFPSL